MDHAFSDDQEAIRATTRRFARDRLAPAYKARESEGRIDRDLVLEMGGLGLIGADLPERLGAPGLDSVTAGVIMEEVGRADINVAYVQLLGSLMGSILASHAKREVAEYVVPRICAGEAIVALGLTEPAGGSDAAHLKTKARKDGGDYILSGEKTSISMAEQADHVVVLARTNEANPGAGGVSAFLTPLDAPGISRSSFDDVGSRAVGRGSIFFDDVRVPARYLIGTEGKGFAQVMQGFDYSRALIGLQCLGSAAASLEETWKYVTERFAFGNPLAKYQGVTEPLAEAETYIEAARLLCYKTLWLRDNGLPHTAEAAMCKWWAPKTAFQVIHRCLLTHGHGGYSTDLPHQQRLRDVMGLQIGDGTEQIQKMIISRERVGRVAVPYA
ncbi:MAG: acyl-CoA dehydrogenase family protein [Parvibaculum sp.]|nr:acyl-CoA dehydrogenase family protein [Parvibaculum sp.]